MPAPVLQFKRGNAGVAGTVPALRPGEPAISLNNFDFFIGIDTSVANNKFFGSHRYWGREDGTNSLRLKLVDRNGTNGIHLKTPNTVSGITTYTLPETPINSYILTTNDSGVLSWTNAIPGGTLTGITTFTDTTDNTLGNADTGAVQIDGGLGVNKNVTVGGNLNVQGYSNFVGVVTFQGGTINIGDSNTDNINVSGEFISNLSPNADNTYDIGISTQRWRDAKFAGIGSFATGVYADGIRLGISAANEIDTTSGNLVLRPASGRVVIDNHLDVNGDVNATGNISLGGTTITLRGTDVFIENKDIILGYTTSITPNDDTANHAGVAIASTEGSPLVSFTASGINTLPDTYKQMMWFQSGTLGFATDVFAFNYGVAIGTTTVANGVRLAVGTGITMSDTGIKATNFYGAFSGNASSADQVKTVTASDTNATYHITFVDANNGSATNETVYTDDGIYYNPGTNTFTTQHALFTGDITVQGTIVGIASTARTVNTTGTSDNATYYVTFVDTSGGQVGETLRTGTALSLNASTGNVKSAGDLLAGSGYLASANGTRSMYMYDTSGDVSFQGKVISDNYRSQSNASNTLTFTDLDATFARNLNVTGIATVGTSLSTPTIKTSTIQHSNGTSAATIDTSGNITASQSLTVAGNLYVNGSTTQVNTAELTVYDRTITLGIQSGTTPTTTTWDLGVLMNYGDIGVAKTAGVIWEYGNERFVFSANSDNPSSSSSSTPNITVSAYAPIEIGALWVNDCAGQSQVISCTGTERFLENITIDCGSF